MLRRAYFMAALLAFFPLSAAFAQHIGDLETYREAGAKFASLVAEAERDAGQKRLQTDEADRLVDVLSDEKRFLKSGEYTAKELEGLIDLCGLSNRAVMSLALFSLKDHIDPKADPQVIAEEVLLLMQRNVQVFVRHLLYLQPFLIRCMAKQAQPMAEFANSLTPAQFTEIRREGLRKMQAGTAQMFVSFIQNVSNSGNDEAYRLSLVQTLAETAPDLIPTLPVAIRLQIRSIVLPAKESAPPGFVPYLNKIDRALADKTCDGLCKI